METTTSRDWVFEIVWIFVKVWLRKMIRKLQIYKGKSTLVSILSKITARWRFCHSVWKSPKCCIWIFEFWHFLSIFVQLKLTCLVTLFDRKLQVFKNSPKLTIFGIFNQLLSTQNVNVARFARNVEWYFSCDFQTPWPSVQKLNITYLNTAAKMAAQRTETMETWMVWDPLQPSPVQVQT